MTAKIIKDSVAVQPTLFRGLLTLFLGRGASLDPASAGLEQSQVSRQVAIREMKVEQAREHLDLCLSALQMLTRAERSLGQSRKQSHQTRALAEIASLLEAAGRTGYKIDALDDPVMADLNESLRLVAGQLRSSITELAGTLRNPELVDRNVLSERMSAGHQKAMAYLAQMQVRLNTLV